MNRALAALLFSLSALAPQAARAWGLEGSAGSLDLGGSIRTIPALVQEPLADPSLGGLDQTILRLTVSGKLSDVLRLELHAVETLSLDYGGPATGYTQLGMARQRYRAFDLRWSQLDQDHLSLALELDRAALRLSLPHLDVTIGRQAINFSKTYFWNPLDTFLPFDPRAFDRDYKPGVDAARIQIALGETAGVELVSALGPTLAVDATVGAVSIHHRFLDSTNTGAALLVRAFATLAHVDLSLQVGKVYGGVQLGAGAAGELFGFGARGEATLFRADPSLPMTLLPDGHGGLREANVIADGASIVVGVDRRFNNDLVLALELFHNGTAAANDLILSAARVALGQTQSLSRDLGALSAKFPLTPVWSVSCAALVSFSDRSSLVSPGITWSAADEVEVLAGGLIGLGPRPRPDSLGVPSPESEFGSYPNLIWLEAKLYF